jgi:hypothetical protein
VIAIINLVLDKMLSSFVLLSFSLLILLVIHQTHSTNVTIIPQSIGVTTGHMPIDPVTTGRITTGRMPIAPITTGHMTTGRMPIVPITTGHMPIAHI